MRHLLLTLMVLLTASGAVADSFLYLEDFEVNHSQQTITVPIKASFNGRVSGFQVDLTYPEGLTPVSATSGADLKVSYLNENGQESSKEANYFSNNDYTRLIAVFMNNGYWYPEDNGDLASYGVIKWEAGEYDEMILLTLAIDEGFSGGEIIVDSEVDAGDDARGGTVRDLGEASVPHTQVCYVAVEEDPVKMDVPAPVMTSVVNDDHVVVVVEWPESDGERILLLDGEMVALEDNQIVIPRGTEDREIMFEAYITEGDLYMESEHAMYTVIIPALPDPDPEPVGGYSLTMADAELLQGNTVVIPVSMTNEELVTAFQTDLCLPEGFELQSIELTGRKSDHTISYNVMSDGVVRILCYSPSLLSFNGYEGVLFNLTVKVPDSAAGDYTLYLKNSLLTTDNYAEVRCEDVTSNLRVFRLGDVNRDGVVDVADVVATAQYILGYDPQPFDFDAADMNGDNQITVTDVVLITRRILDPTYVDLLCAPARGENNDAMSADGIHLAAGETRTVAIALDNEFDYTAFQLDVQLPDGLTATNFCLTNRAGSHAFITNEVDGKQRVMCYSPALAAIAGHEGALLTFDVTASESVSGDIMVDGIEMVTTACGTVCLDGFTIGVNSDGYTTVKELAGDLRIYADGSDIIVESPIIQQVVICDVAGHSYSVNVTEGRNVIPARFSGVVVVNAGSKTAKLMVK